MVNKDTSNDSRCHVSYVSIASVLVGLALSGCCHNPQMLAQNPTVDRLNWSRNDLVYVSDSRPITENEPTPLYWWVAYK